jgi:hypothetical protein
MLVAFPDVSEEPINPIFEGQIGEEIFIFEIDVTAR